MTDTTVYVLCLHYTTSLMRSHHAQLLRCKEIVINFDPVRRSSISGDVYNLRVNEGLTPCSNDCCSLCKKEVICDYTNCTQLSIVSLYIIRAIC